MPSPTYQADDQVPQARQNLIERSSSKVTSRTQSRRFSMPQCPRERLCAWHRHQWLGDCRSQPPVSCPSRPAGALADTPVADAATLPRPSQRCPRSHLALGRPRPTTLAAPAAHDAALLEHRPRPSAWPRVLTTPLPAREAVGPPALSVPSRGKSHLQVSAQGGLILFNWQQILSAACHNLLTERVGSEGISHYYPTLQGYLAQYFFDRRQFFPFARRSYLRQHAPARLA